MDDPKAIDFDNSYLHWITRSETSHGWFRIDTFLEWFPKGHHESVCFVAAKPVPAGRMYAKSGPLLKQPPYSFQLIAGEIEHKIIRRALDHHQTDVPTDSNHSNGKTFESLNWNLSCGQARTLSADSLAEFTQPPRVLNLVVELVNEQGLLRLQGPLHHWNHRKNPPGWQIETGPVLWPSDLRSFSAKPNTSWLSPAWIHANQSDRVTVSGDSLSCQEFEAQIYLLKLT